MADEQHQQQQQEDDASTSSSKRVRLEGGGGEEEEAAAASAAASSSFTFSSAATSATLAPAKDFEVPQMAINKILKAALPDGANCTKDAKTAFGKAAGIFVLYITACANDLAKSSKRSTINSEDIMTSLVEMGYASFIPHLEAALERMRAESLARKEHKTKPKKASSAASAASAGGGGEDEDDDGAGGEETAAAAATEGGGGEPVVGALALL